MHIDHICPRVALVERLRVAHDEEEVPRARHCHIQTPHVSQKAKTRLQGVHCVRSYTIENHDILLTTLERIDSVDLDVTQLAVHISQVWTEGILQVLHLGLVRSDDRDFARQTLSKRAPLTSYFVDEADQTQGELDLIIIQLRLVLRMLPRLLQVEEDAASDHG